MSSPRYRVEHHQLGQISVLAILNQVPPHHRTLDLFVSQLLLHGKQGWVRLVDESTGEVVANRRIEPMQRAFSRR